jgi:hypothetical protein
MVPKKNSVRNNANYYLYITTNHVVHSIVCYSTSWLVTSVSNRGRAASYFFFISGDPIDQHAYGQKKRFLD